MELKRDENKITVYGGVSSADLLTVLPLKVDPVTGRLLIGIDICSTPPTPLSKSTFIDDNKVNVNSAVLDDATQDTMTVSVCTGNKGLNVDILFE